MIFFGFWDTFVGHLKTCDGLLCYAGFLPGSEKFRASMNALRAVKSLVLVSILATYFVDQVCVADWIVESEWDEFDVAEAENGEKVILDSASDEVDVVVLAQSTSTYSPGLGMMHDSEYGTWDDDQEAEDGEKVRILKDFANITKQVDEDNFSQTELM